MEIMIYLCVIGCVLLLLFLPKKALKMLFNSLLIVAVIIGGGTFLMNAVVPSAAIVKPEIPKEKPKPKTEDKLTFTTETPEEKTRAYIDKYAKAAQVEMELYGIPASITLAQGVLESGAGSSELARECNNHFGIKCFAQTCGKGHCKNYHDDSHKDFFRVYKSVWESYRAHSLFLLRSERYKKCFTSRDYKHWAYNLKLGGYATNPNYATDLIKIIKKYELYKYDK